MSAGITAGEKLCCKCGKDVTHIGRMKASDGRYWCIDCGKADEQKRVEHAGGSCFVCGDNFTKPELTKLGGHVYCPKCVKKQFGVKQSFFGKVWKAVTGR